MSGASHLQDVSQDNVLEQINGVYKQWFRAINEVANRGGLLHFVNETFDCHRSLHQYGNRIDFLRKQDIHVRSGNSLHMGLAIAKRSALRADLKENDPETSTSIEMDLLDGQGALSWHTEFVSYAAELLHGAKKLEICSKQDLNHYLDKIQEFIKERRVHYGFQSANTSYRPYSTPA